MRDAGGGAGAGERGAETVGAEALEHRPLRNAILARHELTHGREKAPAAARLVDVAPAEPYSVMDGASPGSRELSTAERGRSVGRRSG